MVAMERIRNFAIISHVDHGKSTLADRLLELTGTIEQRKMRAQVLDAMDLERERGITIKLTPVRMEYTPVSGSGPTLLNLIDTPGHVDFSYEVSRSLAAVEGAILLVDATQGIQAQTYANLELAKQAHLAIVPVVNKIDLPNADIAGVRRELSAVTGEAEDRVLLLSAKTGEGVRELLDTLVERVPPPRGDPTGSFRALVFDSLFDAYRGVIVFVRVCDGMLRTGESLAFAASGAEVAAIEVGMFRPDLDPSSALTAGEIGYIATGLREVARARVGDTILRKGDRGRVAPLLGYTLPHPNIYAGLYPASGEVVTGLREALGKLQLSDASLAVEPEQSAALGPGYRCGFLGVLHLEIVVERLRREYGVDAILTVPSVAYRVVLTAGESRTVRSAVEFPDPATIDATFEPSAHVTVLCRTGDIGAVLQLLAERGGTNTVTETLGGQRVTLTSELPLREIIVGFHEALETRTSGYGSFSFQMSGERSIDLVKLSVLVHHEPVAALGTLVPRAHAPKEGHRIVERLKAVMPRHLFPIPLQAAVGGTIVARETIPALRKDVTGHLYGGDVTRKRKLLERQKRGKARLAARSTVRIPPEAFRAVFLRS